MDPGRLLRLAAGLINRSFYVNCRKLTGMRTVLFLLVLFLFSCSKEKTTTESIPTGTEQNQTMVAKMSAKPPKPTSFVKYTIQEGAHYCDQSSMKSVSGTVMNFVVKFDNTAIYDLPVDGYDRNLDVNKLWGFSEGFNNQYNSARIGWRYYNNELQLFAYVYVNGTVLRDPISYDPIYIKTVEINKEINCSIAVSGNNYVFTVDGTVMTTARGATGTKYNGYQQYPYFGGEYTSPHLINIYVK
jgi:hypothetical protein